MSALSDERLAEGNVCEHGIQADLNCCWQCKDVEIERLKVEKTEIIGIVQRWQPAGSSPPGSAQMLVRWICQALEQRAEKAEAAIVAALDENQATKVLTLRIEELKDELAAEREGVKRYANKWRAERERAERLVLDAEGDIKAMGIEAHPAVLMRLDRLVRALRHAAPVHEPMGVHAPQWCATCSADKPMNEWVAWPCPAVPEPTPNEEVMPDAGRRNNSQSVPLQDMTGGGASDENTPTEPQPLGHEFLRHAGSDKDCTFLTLCHVAGCGEPESAH